MKKNSQFILIVIILLGLSYFIDACKKSVPSPVFVVTFTNINLQDGTAGVQFYATCTTTDVQMTKVDILDPSRTNTVTYNLKNVTYYKGDVFALQDVGVGYIKTGGNYQFTFTGTRLADNTGFGTITMLNVAKK